MWRRASSKLLSLRSVARPNRIVTSSPSPVTLRSSAIFAARHYSGKFFFSPQICIFIRMIGFGCLIVVMVGNVSKKVEDVMPIATGHEREELEAELEGREILDINFPEGPFGTKASTMIN
ncbi:hypothetical protein SSX86_031476, partial [Deinandra increscens subsp. villosa]